MGASDVKAGGAYVEIFSDNSRLVRGLKAAQSQLTGWASGLRSIGTKIAAPLALAGVTGVAAIMTLGEQFGEMGAQASDMANRIGTSTEAVTELSHAAEFAGADAATLERGWMGMQKTIANAAGGSKSAREALADLGMSAEQLMQLSPEDQFAALADGVNQIEDPAKRTAAAMAVFGKSGQQLLPMLSEGSAGIAALRQEARDLGRSMSGEDAESLAAMTDSIQKLKASLTAVAVSLFTAVAPAITAAFEWVTKLAGGVARWVSDNRSLILTAIAVAAGIGGIGVALVGLSGVISLASMVIGGFVTLWVGLGAVLSFVLSPIGLVIIALAGLATWFFGFTEAGRSSLGWIAEAFGTLKDDALTAWGGIVAAIQAGDLQTAFEVAMAFLRLQWVRVTNFLESKWLDFRDAFLDVWQRAQAIVSKAFINTAAVLETAWVQSVDFLADAWTSFTTRFMNGWRTAQNFVGKGFAWLIAKMEGLDPNEVMAEMDADLARRNSGASGSADASILAREQERQRRLAQIEQNRQGSLGEVDNMTGQKRDQRSRARDAADQREQAALAAAQKRLADAAAKANQLQADRATKQKPGGNSLQGQLAGGAVRSQQAANSADIRSAEGLKQILSAFGGGGADQQTANNTARMAKGVEQTNAKLDGIQDELDRTRRDDSGDVLSLDGAN